MNKRLLLLIGGHLSVILGIIGAVLPVVPSTPFMILAAYCYSKSSPKLHQKILNLPHIGSHVRDWEDHGLISVKAKVLSIILLGIMISFSIYFLKVTWLKIMLAVIALAISTFIFSRPSVKKS
jgi:uncharacterized membrane protein YbaN (DUF454 family)